MSNIITQGTSPQMQKIIDSQTGIQKTQLISKNVKEFIDPNLTSLAIRDTNYHFGTPLDVTDCFYKSVKVVNTMDQPVNVGVDGDVNGTFYGLGDVYVTVPSESQLMLTGTDIKKLGYPINKIRVYAICSTAPTTGNLTVVIDRQ